MNYLKEKKKEIGLFVIGLIIMGLICLLFYQPFMSLISQPQKLRHQLQSYGLLGQFIFMCIMALQVIFVFLPGEVIEIMGGYLYAPLGGLIICLLGSALGSMIIYIFVKHIGIRFIQRFVGLDKIRDMQFLQNKEHLNILLFIIFFIPGTPKDMMTYFISLTDMKLSTFLIITTIARIPSIITSTIGGHAIGVEDYVFSIIVFVITGIISIGGIMLYKKIVHHHEINYHL